MKIGFLAGTLGRGGAERQLIYMLRALSMDGVQTRVLCLTKGEAFEKEIRDLGIDVDWVGGSQNNFSRLGRIVANIQKQPVDVLQSSHFYTNIYAAAAGRILGIRSIGAIRNDLWSELTANGIFARWHLRLPQRLIANSQLAVERAIAKGILPANIDLVRNVVAKKNGDKSHRSTEKAAIKILFVGRLVPQKRPELFIEMASQMRTRLADTNLHFVIAGDGPLRHSLEELARERGLENNGVEFIGETSEMSDVYLSADILVLTSDHEGTPNVVLEAMAHGVPLVATKVGGVPEIVNEKCGILVDPGNLTGLIEGVTKLIVDRNLREQLGRQGQEYVRKNHSIGYLQERLHDIYSKVLGTPVLMSQPKGVGG